MGERNCLNKNYTFESFIVGQSNYFASVASKRVSEYPSRYFNPLLIYGGTGFGKTHLLCSIGNDVVKRTSDEVVCYFTAEELTNKIVAAVRSERVKEFYRSLRNADLLLVDDIHFLTNKTATMSELFRIFKMLCEKQKQIVISTDNAAEEFRDLTERFQKEFDCPLIADIQPADTEMKIEIINKRAADMEIEIPDDVTLYIATTVQSNISEINGCLLNLGAHASLTGQKIEIDMAKAVLKNMIKKDNKPVNLDALIKEIEKNG